MKSLYCISGLGADERVFSKLNVPGYDLKPISWIQPLKDETLQQYAGRLACQLEETNPMLLGLSFGGMMAIEISKLLPVSKIILISSIKTFEELPRWMNVVGKARAYNLLPSRQISSIKALRALRPIQNYFLGAHSNEEKRIANEFRDQVDPIYLKWAIGQVMTWKNHSIPANLVHLHGDKDHIFPIKKIKNVHVINGGGHFMIMDKAAEVSSVLRDLL